MFSLIHQGRVLVSITLPKPTARNGTWDMDEEHRAFLNSALLYLPEKRRHGFGAALGALGVLELNYPVKVNSPTHRLPRLHFVGGQ
jgi:hypothetical protein